MLLETSYSCRTFFYTGKDYNGWRLETTATKKSELSSTFNNRISSIKVYSTCWTCVYTGYSYKGSKYCFTGRISNLEVVGLDNKIKSFAQGKINEARDVIFYE